MKPFVESRQIAALSAEFGPQAQALLSACERRGVILKPFYTLRGPGVQAKLWCQSRSAGQIIRYAEHLRAEGAPWVANLLDVRWAKSGPSVTNAAPGLSWHQWGEAIDCFVQGSDGKAVWNARHAGYKVYAEEAKKLCLEPGAMWRKLPDAVHVQLRMPSSPLAAGCSWPEIDAVMRGRFGASD
jgi:hypothetical protein